MTHCPSTEQLESLLDDHLSGSDSEAISVHVGSCDHCQATLERLTKNGGAISVHPSTPPAPDDPSVSDFLSRLKKSHHSGHGDGNIHDATLQPSYHENPVIPGYEIESELGRGGMGVVYKARQIALNRPVALKMILAGKHAGPKDLIRFRQEAEAVARLRHPNIVQIHDIGESEGRPHFALEFVEGGSLVNRLRGDPQPVMPTAELIEQLARAIHFAHQHHVVHRDLKPANILLVPPRDSRLEAVPSRTGADLPAASLYGVPKLTDFGLAKRLDESSGTLSGEVVGTPSYMAPEQAAARTLLIGPSTDVYALGAILYEMLTGRPPFKGATSFDTVVQVLHEEPVRPSSLRPGLPRDLETICLKCLNKEPAKRYVSAEELANDLRRFRHGKPILARPVGVVERAWKWAKRHPMTAALLVGMILVTLLGFAGITWQWHQTRLARDAALAEKLEKEEQRLQAEQARADAEKAQADEAEQRQRARLALYYSRIAESQLQWRVNDFAGAVQSLARCRPGLGQSDRRGWEWYYLYGLHHTELFTLQHRLGGVGGDVDFNPEGRWVASVVGGHPPEETDRQAEVCIWDARDGRLMHALPGPGSLHRLDFHPDGERLALAGTDGSVYFWNATTGKEILRRKQHTQAIMGLTFSHDGRKMASASWDRTVKLWDAGTGDVLHTLRGHEDRVHSVAFHPKGVLVASGSWDTTIKVWDVVKGTEVQTLRGHKSPVYSVDFSPDGQLLASAASNGNLKIWELATGKVIQNITGNAGAILNIAFSPDGRSLVYSGGDATVRVWDVESGVERILFRGHTASVDNVRFSPDGQRLVSSSPGQGVIKVWDLTRHPEYSTFAHTGPDIEAIAFQDEGKQLVSVTIGGKLQTWDATTGVLREERTVGMSDSLTSPAVLASFNPGGTLLAGRSRENPRLVRIWDVATGKVQMSLPQHTWPVLCVRFNPDGRLLATCGYSGDDKQHEIHVWETENGKLLMKLNGAGKVCNIVFRDSQLLAVGGEDGMLAVIDLATRQRIDSVAAHKNDVAALAFSPNGKLMASGGLEDRTIKIWDVSESDTTTGPARRLVHTLVAPSLLCDLAFSPDSGRLAGISRDLVKVWDAVTGQEVLTLRGAPQRHWDPAFNPRVVFSPNGRRLAGTNWDESISLWDAPEQSSDSEYASHQAERLQAANERALFWHLQEAEHCLEHKNLAAARFHLNRLKGVNLPGPLQARRKRLELQLGG